MAKAWLLLYVAVFFASVHFASCTKVKLKSREAADPIRRIITMLNMMAQKIAAEGKDQEALYDTFMCECKTDIDELGGVVHMAEEQLPKLKMQVQEMTAEKKQLDDDVFKATQDRQAAIKELQDATTQRGKEAETFQHFQQENQEIVNALHDSMPAMQAALTGGSPTGDGDGDGDGVGAGAAGDGDGDGDGGGTPPAPPPDGGTPPADGGTPPADGGTPPADGGTPPADGGTPPADGGTPPADGGTPPAGDGTTFLQKNKEALWKIKKGARRLLSPADRKTLLAFLSEEPEAAAEAAAGPMELSGPFMEIMGIMKQMEEKAETDLSDDLATENKQIEEFNALEQAKNTQIGALATEIQTKTTRLGQITLQLVQDQQDYDNLKSAYEATYNNYKNRKKQCDMASATEGERQKQHHEELKTIADTVQMLNGDQTAALFKHTFPEGTNFLQVRSHPDRDAMKRRRILNALSKAAGKHGSNRLALLAMTVKNKKTSFDRVLMMIDNMMKLMMKEGRDAEFKRDSCEKELEATADEIQAVDDLLSETADQLVADKATLDAVEADIKTLRGQIETLDKEVLNATEFRKNEHAEFLIIKNDKQSAKDALLAAKKKLDKLFGVFMQRDKHHRRLKPRRQHKLVENLWSDMDQPAEIPVFMQVHRKKAREWRRQAGGDVVGMLDTLMAEVDNEMQSVVDEEDDAQRNFEIYVEDAQLTRELDAAELAEKEEAKAEKSASYRKGMVLRRAKTKSRRAKAEYLSDKHRECDDLIQNFDHYENERINEMDALERAKYILEEQKDLDM